MIESSLLQWSLTALFAGTGCWNAYRLAAPGSGRAARIDALCHVLMSALMAAMLWPWGMEIPATPQIVVFLVASVWFLAGAITGLHGAGESGHGGSRVAHLHHTVMMAAMAWMVAVMPSLMASGSDGDGGGHHHALTSGVSALAPASDGPSAGSVIATVLGVLLIASCLPWLSSAFDQGRRPGLTTGARRCALDRGCHAAMTFGMGIAFLAMS